MLAAEQHHVDELRGGVRALACGEGCPQLVEAVRPRAAAAFLGQRDGMLQAAGLAREQLKVMIESGAGEKLAMQALVTRDDPAAVVDRDLSRAPTAR